MGRPRTYDLEAALDAVRDVFWEQGYEQVSIGDLERCTGLDRSSLYNAFGSKRALFEAALDRYEALVRAQLTRMREGDAGVDDIVAFFRGTARELRADVDGGRRGCFMVNTIAELGGSDGFASGAGKRYRDALHDAFAAVLDRAASRGEIDASLNDARSRVLAAAVMGCSLSARLDPVDAAETSEAVAAEVRSWRLRSARPQRGRA